MAKHSQTHQPSRWLWVGLSASTLSLISWIFPPVGAPLGLIGIYIGRKHLKLVEGEKSLPLLALTTGSIGLLASILTVIVTAVIS